jgi:hypothetical protein
MNLFKRTSFVFMVSLVISVFIASNSFADCSMMAMLTRTGTEIHEFGDWQSADGVVGVDTSLHFDIYSSNINDYSLTNPYDYFVFLGQLSSNMSDPPNDDGYGVIYYKDGQITLPSENNPQQRFHLKGTARYYKHTYPFIWDVPADQDTLEKAYDAIRNENNDAVIVLGHARWGHTGSGSHPFWYNADEDDDTIIDRTYTLEHNGTVPSDVKEYMLDTLNANWFDGNLRRSNWITHDPPYDINEIIDSEVLFHFIMKHVEESNGDVIGGIVIALNEADDACDHQLSIPPNGSNGKNVINFILSDGKGIYAFKNAPDSDLHKLFYKVAGDLVTVKTCTHANNGPLILQHDLVYIPRDTNLFDLPYDANGICTFENIFDNEDGDAFISTDITSTPEWEDRNYYIIGDIDVTDNLNIENNAKVYFTGAHELEVRSFGKLEVWNTGELNITNNATVKINGAFPTLVSKVKNGGVVNVIGSNFEVVRNKVTLENGSELNLSKCATVTVDGGNYDAKLFLDWGATITGCTPTTYIEPVGTPVPGDRIMAVNSGMITTKSKDDYYSTAPTIYIKKLDNGQRWDGISIDAPLESTNEDGMYWFTNCDISGIVGISMKEDNDNTYANLNFYKSRFHHSGSITVRDKGILKIQGCEVDSNYTTPIKAYSSQVIMDIDNDDMGNVVHHNSNSYGISLNYPPPTTTTYPYDKSLIKYTNFYENQHGCHGNGHKVLWQHNHIYENNLMGFICYAASYFRVENDTIENNGNAEFFAKPHVYDMAGGENVFNDDSGYLLVAPAWTPDSSVIDVSGNTFNGESSTDQVYPVAAFSFGNQQRMATILLNSAREDMDNGNYDAASVTYEQIISDYSQSDEAISAVIGLYFIENFTDRNFAEFRNYLDAIPAEDYSDMYLAKEDLKTKSYMDEGIYDIAIERLEELIADPFYTEDDKLYAMMDEAYCYMKLSEDGARSIPFNCTVKTATFSDFTQKIEELNAQLSFNNLNKDIGKEVVISTPKPVSLSLSNYPNPFNPATTINFSIPEKSDVQLCIYDVTGKLVKTLVNKKIDAGTYKFVWDGRDETDRQTASGIYFSRLTSEGKSAVNKMILLK